MGIVNLGGDSFSGDGITDLEKAVAHTQQLVRDGADIIDIGAETARTNRLAISEQQETDQLCAFIEKWRERNSEITVSEKSDDEKLVNETSAIPLSINTWRPGVARAVLETGGDILNDIGALPTDENARICAKTGAALLIMHSIGEPKIAHTHVAYDDVLERLDAFFTEKIAVSEAAGLSRDALILDPGIDFAKQRADNLRIYRHLDRLQKFGRPVLLPVSRKTVIGDVLAISEPRERDAGTVACIVSGMQNGAQIFRVHNVKAAAETVRMIWALR